MIQLYAVFGPNLRSALELIDNGSITKVLSEKQKQVIYQVKGSIGVTYLILPDSWRCSCTAWLQQTWIKGESFTCKHVLAVKLCEKTGSNFKESETTEELFAKMLMNMD